MVFFESWIYEVSHLLSIQEKCMAGLMTIDVSWKSDQ